MKRFLNIIIDSYHRADLAYRKGFNHIFFSCERMSELASERLDRKLSLKERIATWIHLTICSWCRLYDRQIRFLHETFHGQPSFYKNLPELELSKESKARILQKVKESSPD